MTYTVWIRPKNGQEDSQRVTDDIPTLETAKLIEDAVQKAFFALNIFDCHVYTTDEVYALYD